MASRLRQKGSEDSGETNVDISPLIDCVFILLIFFIVTTTFVEEKGLDVDKPAPSPPTQSQDDQPIVFNVNKDGRIFFRDREIRIGGVIDVVKRELDSEEQAIIIKPADSAQSGMVIQVADTARQAGARNISLARGPAG
jgi:biopolymer transport protein ExbD